MCELCDLFGGALPQIDWIEVSASALCGAWAFVKEGGTPIPPAMVGIFPWSGGRVVHFYN